jgi:hypothetical protein
MSQEELPKQDVESTENKVDANTNSMPPHTASENTSEEVDNISPEPLAEEQANVEAETEVENATSEPVAEETAEDNNVETAVEVESQADEDVEADEEAQEMEDETIAPLELDGKSKDDLLALAIEATQKFTPREAFRRLQQIRPAFNDLLRAEKRDALQKYVEEGNEPEGFEYSDESYREQFKNAFNLAKNARMEERQRIEEEKQKNLKKKEALLEKLRSITENDETEKSLEEVKEIQQEWRAIRVLPAEKVQELWDSYHFLLDKFYDNHSINIELKELDRKKNLEVKIELCKKVDELSKETSLKKSFIMLNKYQEEFRNTGPVPREFNQEIWDRFRTACDNIYEQKRAIFSELEEKRNKNLELKLILIEKADLVAQTTPKKVKDWKDKTTELDNLMAEWKRIGQVPKAQNEEVWKKFRKAFNTFYDNKSNFFKQLNKERKANLILKEDICKRAEEVKDSEDMNFATNELKKLQREWKEIGPVPEKVSNAVWKRFRAACDEFFDKKQKAFEGKKEEENQNLTKKQELISKLEGILDQGKSESILNELKAIQKEWNSIGYVPLKSKKQIENQYRKASDAVFNKFKLDKQSIKQGQMKDHYENLAQLPSGKQKLSDEEFKLKKKMKFLSGEISTLENNMEFFGRSKGAQKLKDEIAGKIEKTKDQLARLKAELKVIQQLKSAPKKEQESTPAE